MGVSAFNLKYQELLQSFNVPHSMDYVFKTRNNRNMVYQRPSNLACTITPLVVTAIFCDLWGDKGGSQASLEHCRAKSQSTRQSLIDNTVIKEKVKPALEDDNVSHSSSSNEPAPPGLILQEVDLSSEESSSSEESTLPPPIVRKGSSSWENTSINTGEDVGIPSHGWDLETYESFLPGTFIHIDFAHIVEQLR